MNATYTVNTVTLDANELALAGRLLAQLDAEVREAAVCWAGTYAPMVVLQAKSGKLYSKLRCELELPERRTRIRLIIRELHGKGLLPAQRWQADHREPELEVGHDLVELMLGRALGHPSDGGVDTDTAFALCEVIPHGGARVKAGACWVALLNRSGIGEPDGTTAWGRQRRILELRSELAAIGAETEPILWTNREVFAVTS
jgi:hypothetical protein